MLSTAVRNQASTKYLTGLALVAHEGRRRDFAACYTAFCSAAGFGTVCCSVR